MSSNASILIDHRIRQYRLNRNMTQSVAAQKAGLSETAIKKQKKGSKLSTYIKIFTVLGMLEHLLAGVPDEGESPVQLMKSMGKKR